MKKLVYSHPYLEVRKSSIHSMGVYARIDIPARTKIIEYTGEKITHAESDRREVLRRKRKAKGKRADVFMFELNSRWYIDGSSKKNMARWINHSCNENCKAYQEGGRIWYYSKRAIQKGEEITIDYGFDFQVWNENRCYCKSVDCLGYIVRRNIRWRVKRRLGLFSSRLHV